MALTLSLMCSKAGQPLATSSKQWFDCMCILSKDVCFLGFFLGCYFFKLAFDESDNGAQKHTELERV